MPHNAGLQVDVQPLVEVLESVSEPAIPEWARVRHTEGRAQLLPPRFMTFPDRPEKSRESCILKDDVLQLIQERILVRSSRASLPSLIAARVPATTSAEAPADELLKSMLSM